MYVHHCSRTTDTLDALSYQDRLLFMLELFSSQMIVFFSLLESPFAFGWKPSDDQLNDKRERERKKSMSRSHRIYFFANEFFSFQIKDPFLQYCHSYFHFLPGRQPRFKPRPPHLLVIEQHTSPMLPFSYGVRSYCIFFLE